MTEVRSGGPAASPDDLRAIAAALAAAVIGALFYNVLPLYLGTAADSRALTNEEIGFLGAAFFMGFNLAGASAFVWARAWPWRRVAMLAVPAALAALLASAVVTSYGLLMLATVVSGGALGAMFSMAGVALGDTSQPTRWYGVKTAVESLTGAALMILLTSPLSPWTGLTETAVGMVVVIILLAPFLLFLPTRVQAAAAGPKSHMLAQRPRPRPYQVYCALGVVFVFFAGNSGIWAFAERLGARSEFDPGAVGALLSFTLVCGVGGSLAVAAWGPRLNPVLLIGASCAGVVIALAALGLHYGFAGYAFGLSLYMVGWSVGVPLGFSEVARFDPDGRYTALATPALGLGSMAGPAVVGMLFGERGETGPVIVFGVICMLTTLALALAANAPELGAVLRRRAARPAP